MSVEHLRIDNRLIHGQVTASWTNKIGTDHIIVVNDKVAQDPIQKKMLPRAARGIETSVLSVDEAAEYITSEKGKKDKIMVIAKLPSDALGLLEKGVEPKEINVGNQALVSGEENIKITKSISIMPKQAEVYKKISDKGYNLTYKVMPSDSGGDFIKTLKEKDLL